jgi:hypothetical protein
MKTAKNFRPNPGKGDSSPNATNVEDSDNDDIFDDHAQFWHLSDDVTMNESRYACNRPKRV